MIINGWLGGIDKAIVMLYFEVIYCHFPETSEKRDGKLWLWEPGATILQKKSSLL